MKRLTPPTNQDAQRGQQQVTIDKMKKAIDQKDLKPYFDAAKELLEDHDSVTVVAAAISMMTKERRDTPVRISSAAPISVKKS